MSPSQSMPSQRSEPRIDSTASSWLRSVSVSSTRTSSSAPQRLASSQLNSAALALPTCRNPVGGRREAEAERPVRHAASVPGGREQRRGVLSAQDSSTHIATIDGSPDATLGP